MATAETARSTRDGGCVCGGVRYSLTGEPLRVGICHCTTCRKTSGSAFVAYGVWPRSAFTSVGATREHGGRAFCPACGGRVFSLRPDEAEIMLGSLDEAPNGLAPSREGWAIRREDWLPEIPGAARHDRDPPR